MLATETVGATATPAASSAAAFVVVVSQHRVPSLPRVHVVFPARRSYSQRLASWGYVTLLYDKLETVSDTLACCVATLLNTGQAEKPVIGPLLLLVKPCY